MARRTGSRARVKAARRRARAPIASKKGKDGKPVTGSRRPADTRSV
jgi:hypothetical protein